VSDSQGSRLPGAGDRRSLIQIDRPSRRLTLAHQHDF
jgi:hypothetical protein